MKREDFDRLKDEEKRHLREIQDLKRKLKEAQRMQRIGRALGDVQRAGDLEGFDSSLEEVQRRAAEQEARLDLAATGAESLDTVDLPEIDEEALKRARAADFIKQMKVTMDEDPPSRASSQAGGVEESEEKETESPGEDAADFEKTIGRMTPRGKGD